MCSAHVVCTLTPAGALTRVRTRFPHGCRRTTEKILQVIADPGITAGVEDVSQLTQPLAAVVVNLCGTLAVDTSASTAQLPASVSSFNTVFGNILESVKVSGSLVKTGVIIVISYDHTTWLVHGEHTSARTRLHALTSAHAYPHKHTQYARNTQRSFAAHSHPTPRSIRWTSCAQLARRERSRQQPAPTASAAA